MTLEDLGYHANLAQHRTAQDWAQFEVGRVISEHKERYMIKTPTRELEGELLGNLRYSAESRYDLPAVGDWLAFSEYDVDKALIHGIYPRSTILERQAVSKKGQIQIIATNVDFGLVVQAVDRDFNLNRLERYLTICHAAKVQPVVVLSKTDLLPPAEVQAIMAQIEQRAPAIAIFPVSNQLPDGYELLRESMLKGKTYCLLGSSGVGKSTLLNHLAGTDLMETGHISSSVNKGRHITSHRALTVLPAGGILIDNPGMREVGIADAGAGLETTFERLLAYAEDCRFKDCTHVHERGCAVLEAVAAGELDEAAYANFQKMEREKEHFEADAVARKKKDKAFGKMVKEVKKQRKRNKF